MKKYLGIVFALVLAVSLILVPAVVSANPGNGDVTIVVKNQADVGILGAQVRLFWGEGAYKWMPPKLTNADGSATFSAGDIATWRTANGNPTLFQVNASMSNDFYGSVYTVDAVTEWVCIAYNAGTDYTFTYNLVMFLKAPPVVVWGAETVKVAYTLEAAPADALLAPKIGFFHGPIVGDEPLTPIFQSVPKVGGGYDNYNMIDTNEVAGITPADYVTATVATIGDVTSLSASVKLRFFEDITDTILAVPFLVKTPVVHVGPTGPELAAAEDQYGFASSTTVGFMILNSAVLQMTTNVPAPIISISVSPLSLNFGSVFAGMSSTQDILVTNTSPSVTEDITAEVMNESRAGFYTANLQLDLTAVDTWTIASLGASESSEPPVSAKLTVPDGTTVGTLTATLVFWAKESD